MARFIGRRDEYGLMEGGRADQQKKLHGNEGKRGMAKHGGQLRRLNEKPGSGDGRAKARDTKRPR